MADCAEKNRLLEEQKETEAAFRRILRLVNRSAAKASNEDFFLVTCAAHERHATSKRASLALGKHIGEHGC
jgi:hypothetical protein